jgi:hypothetical protein
VFYAGGVPTLIIAACCCRCMPESLRFLARRQTERKRGRVAKKLDPSLADSNRDDAKAKPPQGKFRWPNCSPAAGAVARCSGFALFFGFWTTTVIVLQTPTLLRLGANVPLQVSATLVASYSIVAPSAWRLPVS